MRGGKSAKTGEVLVLWPCHSFMFVEVQTSLRKLEKKQILGLFKLLWKRGFWGWFAAREDVTRTRCFFILVTSCCAISSTTFRFEVFHLLYREGVNHRQGVMCLPASMQPGQRLPIAGPPGEHPPPGSKVTVSRP